MSSSMATSPRPQAAARAAARAASTSQSATIRASGLARYSMAWRSEMRPVPTMPTPMGPVSTRMSHQDHGPRSADAQ